MLRIKTITAGLLCTLAPFAADANPQCLTGPNATGIICNAEATGTNPYSIHPSTQWQIDIDGRDLHVSPNLKPALQRILQKTLPAQTTALEKTFGGLAEAAGAAKNAADEASSLAKQVNGVSAGNRQDTKLTGRKARHAKHNLKNLLSQAKKSIKAAKALKLDNRIERRTNAAKFGAPWMKVHRAFAAIPEYPTQLALITNEVKNTIAWLYQIKGAKPPAGKDATEFCGDDETTQTHTQCVKTTGVKVSNAVMRLDQQVNAVETEIGALAKPSGVVLKHARSMTDLARSVHDAAKAWVNVLTTEATILNQLQASAQEIAAMLNSRWLLAPTVLDGHVHICPNASIRVKLLHNACKLRVSSRCALNKPHLALSVGQGKGARTAIMCAPDKMTVTECSKAGEEDKKREEAAHKKKADAKKIESRTLSDKLAARLKAGRTSIPDKPQGTWISSNVANVRSSSGKGQMAFLLTSAGCVDRHGMASGEGKTVPGPCRPTMRLTFEVSGIGVCPKPYKFIAKYK